MNNYQRQKLKMYLEVSELPKEIDSLSVEQAEELINQKEKEKSLTMVKKTPFHWKNNRDKGGTLLMLKNFSIIL